MEGLKASRKAYRSHLTRIYHKMEELDLTQPATEEIASLVTSYINQLQRKAETIRQLDTGIAAKTQDPDKLEQEVCDTEEIQDLWIEKTTRLKRYLEAQQPRTTTPSSSIEPFSTIPLGSSPPPPATTAVCIVSASYLPKLSLPTFTVNPLKWQTFWDSFKAAVHHNPNLTGIEKFNYLRAQLEGEASRTVSGFPLTTTNYKQCVVLLKTRFGKQQRIVNAHMQALLDLQALTNIAVSLQQLLDTIESHIRGLESLGKDKSSFGDFLISIVFSKLPTVIRKNFTSDHPSEQWNIDDLCSAIKKEVTVLESGSEKHSDHHHFTITGSFHAGIHKGQLTSQPRERGVSSKAICIYCKGSHVPVHCNVVTDLSARLDIVKGDRLCFNCLGHHKVTHCNSKNRCKRCHKKHHTGFYNMNGEPKETPLTSPPHQSNTHPPVQSTLRPTS